MSNNLSPNDEAVTALVAMGFNEAQARVALLRADNNINVAAELLSNGSKCHFFHF